MNTYGHNYKRRQEVAALALFVTVIVVLTILIIGAFAASSEDGSNEPPYGCTWLDMNPSKGADYQLACVEGYGWDDLG